MLFTITISWRGKREKCSFQCGEDQHLLDAAEEAGFEWPCSSRTGEGPTGAARLISGEIDQSEQSYLDDGQMDKGFLLTGVVYPRSDCALIIGVEQDIIE